jgi:hypothetical protein
MEPDSNRRGTRNTWIAILTAALLAAIICAAALPPVQTPGSQGLEADSYLATAAGLYNHAYLYYATRVLPPLTARVIAHTIGASLPNGFRILACVSLFILFVSVTTMIGDATLVPLLVMPPAIIAFQHYYLGEVFHAALTGTFFLLFALNEWLAIPLLFLLQLTRESTTILSAVIVAIMFRRNPRYSVVAILAGGAGIYVASRFAVAAANPHHLPAAIFYALKLAYNFALNLLGLAFWTDTNGATIFCHPVWIVDVHLGSIRRVGFCGFEWWHPVLTLIAMGLSFGVMPLVLVRGWRIVAGSPRADLRIAFWYGLANFALAPFIGTTVDRYVFYAWPLLWIAGGEILKQLPRRTALLLVGLSLTASWTARAVSPTFALGLIPLFCFVAWMFMSSPEKMRVAKTAA